MRAQRGAPGQPSRSRRKRTRRGCRAGPRYPARWKARAWIVLALLNSSRRGGHSGARDLRLGPRDDQRVLTIISERHTRAYERKAEATACGGELHRALGRGQVRSVWSWCSTEATAECGSKRSVPWHPTTSTASMTGLRTNCVPSTVTSRPTFGRLLGAGEDRLRGPLATGEPGGVGSFGSRRLPSSAPPRTPSTRRHSFYSATTASATKTRRSRTQRCAEHSS
jgi:hypothetical protein